MDEVIGTTHQCQKGRSRCKKDQVVLIEMINMVLRVHELTY